MGVSATSLLLFDFAKIPTFPKLPNFSDRNEDFFCVCGLIPFSEDLFRVICTEVPGYSKRCFWEETIAACFRCSALRVRAKGVYSGTLGYGPES